MPQESLHAERPPFGDSLAEAKKRIIEAKKAGEDVSIIKPEEVADVSSDVQETNPKERVDTPDTEGLLNPELREEMEILTRREILDMISLGIADEMIWKIAKDAGEFEKFKGSSYYRSKKNPKKWCRRSSANNTNGCPYREDEIFEDQIRRQLDNYRELLEMFGDPEMVMQAIHQLENYEVNDTDSIGRKIGVSMKNLQQVAPHWESSAMHERRNAADIVKGEDTETESQTRDTQTQENTGETKKEGEESQKERQLEVQSKKEAAAPTPPPEHAAQNTEEAKRAVESEREEVSENLSETYGSISVGDTVFWKTKTGERSSRMKVERFVEDSDGNVLVLMHEDSRRYPFDEIHLTKKESPDNENKDTLESTPGIDTEVSAAFGESYNISKEELERVAGFAQLSAGQQNLVFRNFDQMIAGQMRESGIIEHKEKLEEAGFFARMGRSMIGEYLKKYYEAEEGKNLLEAGIEEHRSGLERLVSSISEAGLEVADDGHVLFAAPLEEMSPDEAETVVAFDVAAQDFAAVSGDWRYDDALTDNALREGGKQEFFRKKQAYEEAFKRYMAVASKRGEEAVTAVVAADQRVRTEQFFAGSQEYEETLQNVKDYTKLDRSMKYLPKTRAISYAGYFGGGMASRAFSASVLGAAATPAVAAAFGAYNGRRRAKSGLSDEAFLRSRGHDADLTRKTKGKFFAKEKEGEFNPDARKDVEAINTVDAGALTRKLQNLLTDIENPSLSEEKRQEKLTQLRRRIAYTQRKIDGVSRIFKTDDGEKKEVRYGGGLVNYGNEEERIANQYLLMRVLGEAQVRDTLSERPDVEDDVINRLDSFLDYKNDRTKTYVHKKTLKGAGIAGGIAFGGWAVSDIASDDSMIWGTLKDVFGLDDSGAGSAVPEGFSGAALGSQEFVIDESGEGMIGAIAQKLEGDGFGLSHEKAMALGNALYLKGEAASGSSDELFNLVGEGDTFSLDFGDLEPGDLENYSANELADKIDFNNVTDFNDAPGPPQSGPEIHARSGAGSFQRQTEIPNIDGIEDISPADAPAEPGPLYRVGEDGQAEPVFDSDVSARPLSETDTSVSESIDTGELERVPDTGGEPLPDDLPESVEEIEARADANPPTDTPATGQGPDPETVPGDNPASSPDTAAAPEDAAETVSSTESFGHISNIPARVSVEDVNQIPSSEAADAVRSMVVEITDGTAGGEALPNSDDIYFTRNVLDALTRENPDDFAAVVGELRNSYTPEAITSLERSLSYLARDEGAADAALKGQYKIMLSYVREQVAGISGAEFNGEIPAHAAASMKASR